MSDLYGKKAKFLPFISDKDGGYTTGTVVYENKEHRYFRVEYIKRGGLLHECFKFSQIGKDVDIHG